MYGLFNIIAIIGLLLDLQTYGPFAIACCPVLFKIVSVIRMVIDVTYEQQIKILFCSDSISSESEFVLTNSELDVKLVPELPNATIDTRVATKFSR